TGSAFLYAQDSRAEETPRDVFLERAAEGTPHKGKVLLAVQAHSDDIPLMAAGTVAKLVKEGYSGYLLRATNDDMGDAPGLGTPGARGPGEVLLRTAAGDQPRRGRERGGRSDDRRQPREPGQRAGRKSRLAPPGRPSQARPKAPAPRRRRRCRRPQLHPRVHP